MSTYLVTGASRGLGLAFVRKLQEQPPSEVSIVFGTVRAEPSRELQQLADSSQGRLVIIHMTLTEKESIAKGIEQVKKKLDGQGLDVLINNAGIIAYSKSIEEMDNLRQMLEVNVEAVHDVTAALLPLLRQGKQKKIANIGSSVSSMANARKWMISTQYAYKISKAAVNALTLQYAYSLEEEGFAVFSICPGWVKTDMTSYTADLDASTSAEGVLRVIAKNGNDLNGKFLKIHVPGMEVRPGAHHEYNGAEIPW
ncbi:hypothetical protein MCOR25_004367 [Pyricularia grisea]|uniref:NAD(P)-binding protein n=1 Tax=Pyricularia grisea TaxID=148305 RepID=A0A6P8BH79_PYRGI|nr:uncharacterized protein PgNI_02209 [Pyricularia grisea]KAI6369738.1 hypothetical protein MCOR25_004367 [Pyricularia grisea]TLD16133.1 hypothetical protein PgNI_02209 [Pyricularia grisea]